MYYFLINAYRILVSMAGISPIFYFMSMWPNLIAILGNRSLLEQLSVPSGAP